MKGCKYIALIVCFFFFGAHELMAQDFMINIPGRERMSLNGRWNVLIDLYSRGDYMKLYQNKQAEKSSDLYEYSFERSTRLNVPGDWNSQMPELKFYEGTVWYEKSFDLEKQDAGKYFLYFAAVNYRASVYLNGELIGEHEGGFTPFQFEVTDNLKAKDNFLIVRVNNTRTKDAIPAMNFDWWNYGGITRDVDLVHVPTTYINDYFVRLNPNKKNIIDCSVQLKGDMLSNVPVTIEFPELKIKQTIYTDAQGVINTSFKTSQLIRWSPENPKLYTLHLTTQHEALEEQIGFRNMAVKGTSILLNDKEIFLKGISFHEEIPQRMGRAFSQADAYMLLNEAKDLGCNMIRLAHYPQNEYIVRTAEKMGFLLWQEIPVWQGIDFNSKATCDKAERMMMEMLHRDKNRCAVSVWGVANETRPSPSRDAYLKHIVEVCKSIDPTRLYTAAFDMPRFNPDNQSYEMKDSVANYLDFVSVNKYIGWYEPWRADPQAIKWNVNLDKPLVFSEFGAESLHGQQGDTTWASSWTEGYQASLYTNNITMFNNISNLQGVFPWILFDFRSPLRLHSKYQEGWNRKGLVTDQGRRKQAWYIMYEYYKQK